MRFEVTGEKFQRALDRRPRHGNEIAKPFTLVESQDLAELLQDRRAALTLLNLFHEHGQRVCFHTAGGTLAAGLGREKVRDP